jgi:hypothetical protein
LAKQVDIRNAERAFPKSSESDRQLASIWLDGYKVTKSCIARKQYVCIVRGMAKYPRY